MTFEHLDDDVVFVPGPEFAEQVRVRGSTLRRRRKRLVSAAWASLVAIAVFGGLAVANGERKLSTSDPSAPQIAPPVSPSATDEPPSSTPLEQPAIPVARVPADLECEDLDAYEIESAASGTAVFLTEAGLGGPLASLSGDPESPDIVTEDEIFTEEPYATGAHFWRSADGRDVARLDTTRASRSALAALAAWVSAPTGEPPAGFQSHPVRTRSFRVRATACNTAGGFFYGVEVVTGDLAARAHYLLSLNTAYVDSNDEETVAIIAPPGTPKPALSLVSEADFASLVANSDPP